MRPNRDASATLVGGQQALLRYAWPGNVRELSNVMERCVLGPDTVGLCDLPEELMAGDAAAPGLVTKVRICSPWTTTLP
jgi:transcriptional regulator with PAS, ATPase and Fis domain